MVTDINRNDDQPPAGATQQAPDRRHRVLVVDDHPVVTDSIARLLEPVADLEVVATARDVAGALHQLQAGEVDVVLLDLQLDGESGLGLLARLDQRPCVPVLVFSVHPPGQRAVAALEAGARGYLTKGASITTLAAALREVATGGSWITPELTPQTISTYKRHIHHKVGTRTEVDLLRYAQQPRPHRNRP